MKISILLLLIGVIAGISYRSSRLRAKQPEPASPDSMPAEA